MAAPNYISATTDSRWEVIKPLVFHWRQRYAEQAFAKLGADNISVVNYHIDCRDVTDINGAGRTNRVK
jgi:hypothetical protein